MRAEKSEPPSDLGSDALPLRAQTRGVERPPFGMTYTTVSADVIYSAHFGAAMKAECAAAQSLRSDTPDQRSHAAQDGEIKAERFELPAF